MDRVLDKGIVIEATVRVTLIGIDLLGVDAKITVASFQTYLQLSEDPRAYEVGLLAGEHLFGRQSFWRSVCRAVTIRGAGA